MLDFKKGWNLEIQKYASKYGHYAAYLESFDSKAIISALWDAKDHYHDQWTTKFFKNAQDIHDSAHVVTIEQGTHQPEDQIGGGFILHFTGRDADGVAFHFYIKQRQNGDPYIFEITYMDNGHLVRCQYV